jgi:predicted  nucleic acid-binding Zn-ribbon protein
VWRVLQLALADASGEVGFMRQQLAEAKAKNATLQEQLDAAKVTSPHAVLVGGKRDQALQQKEFDENPMELEAIAREVASAQGALDELLEGEGAGGAGETELSEVEQRLQRASNALEELLSAGEDDAEILVQQLSDAKQQLEAMCARSVAEPTEDADEAGGGSGGISSLRSTTDEAAMAEAVEAMRTEIVELKAKLAAAEQQLDTTEYQLQLALAEASGERDFLARQLQSTQSLLQVDCLSISLPPFRLTREDFSVGICGELTRQGNGDSER